MATKTRNIADQRKQKGAYSLSAGEIITAELPGGAASGPTIIINNSDTSIGYIDKFWASIPPSGPKWGEMYPYQFRIVKPRNGGYATVPGGVFTLPITPQQLQIRTPFAVQTTVTLRGILEEHNGAPLREISFSGTTGIWPFRRANAGPQSPTSLESIFGGTLSAVQGLDTAVRALTNEKVSRANISDPAEADDQDILGIDGTGYFQFHLLHQFLERYATLKKGGNQPVSEKGGSEEKSRDLRLAFCMWKDDWVWLISPKQFSLIRSERDPFEYKYNFSGIAWKRVPTLDSIHTVKIPFNPIAQRRNGFQQVLDTLSNARQVLQSSKRVIQAVRADINNALFTPIRETIFAMKDLVGVGATLIDLPNTLVKDFQHTIIREWDSLRGIIDQKFTRRTPSQNSPRPIALLLENSLRKQIQNRETSLPPQSSDPLNKIFSDPISNLSFFDEIATGAINPDPELIDKIEEERDTVASINKSGFEERRNSILAVSADLANDLGLGHETFNRLIGRNLTGDASAELSPVKEVIKEPSPRMLDPLFAMNASAIEFDRLIASRSIDDNKILDAFDFISGLAAEADIDFEIPASKFAVPVPFGLTIEGIANLYLADPDKWLEIATLNNLKAPYIDEDGFIKILSTNASGNKFTIDSKENLYIGQAIKLSSTAVPIFSRRILNIEEISEGNILITVDGDSNLNKLKTSDNAQMKAYLPNTTNSEQLIFMPSSLPPSQLDLKTKPLAGLKDLSTLVKTSGIDLLLTSSGDIAVTKDGDTKLAVGLTNIIQAARLKVETPRGSLLRHPEFGFGIEAGISTVDVSVQDILNAIQGSFLEDDRFAGVDSIQVVKKGPTLQISLLTRIVGLSELVPITVDIKG